MLRNVILFLACASFALGQTYVNPKMRTFSSATKAGRLTPNEEKVLYEHDTGQPGVITEQWFTGKGAMDENTRIRIYIDGESTASLDFQLYLGHGIGFVNASKLAEVRHDPWGTSEIGHTADGDIFNTYRIPFSKSFRVTATHAAGGTYWYIIRGVENYPLRIGDLILPQNTRLRLYKNTGVKLDPYQFITLANVTGTAGLVYQVTIAASSTDYNYLEACGRVKIDNSDKVTYLSSGTEDFFLSAYYFNKGIYHLDESGLTYYDGKGTMSAYKFFKKDPLLFTTSMELIWRNGEKRDGVDGCPSVWPPSNMPSYTQKRGFTPQLSSTMFTTYVWVYEYSMNMP